MTPDLAAIRARAEAAAAARQELARYGRDQSVPADLCDVADAFDFAAPRDIPALLDYIEELKQAGDELAAALMDEQVPDALKQRTPIPHPALAKWRSLIHEKG